MSHLKIPKPWDIAGSEITPESVCMNRREFMKGTALAATAATAQLYGCGPRPAAQAEREPTALEKKLYPAERNRRFQVDRRMTGEQIAATYNNFYEFSDIKQEVRHHARSLETWPWTVEIAGLCRKPRRFDVAELLRGMPLEERVYRFRCVEAWAMVVPWTGFPLKELLKIVEPRSKATHVRFTTFYQPFTAQGQLTFWRPWPYTEGLTLKEAMNELTLLVTGIYGHPLPNQHGAPIRLIVPWKYGFKSIKSIVKIELIDYQPATFWNTLVPHEYSFQANVNPNVPHPRWLQKEEEMIGTEQVHPTRLYNGYGKYVAPLYA